MPGECLCAMRLQVRFDRPWAERLDSRLSDREAAGGAAFLTAIGKFSSARLRSMLDTTTCAQAGQQGHAIYMPIVVRQ